MTYFVPISVGVFTKGLGFADLATTMAELAIFTPVLTGIGLLLLRKQER
jgi:ribosome-dependent ATPase